jgi:hypothetical protein
MRAGSDPRDDVREVGRASEESGDPLGSLPDSNLGDEAGGADRIVGERIHSNGDRAHHKQNGASKIYDREEHNYSVVQDREDMPGEKEV